MLWQATSAALAAESSHPQGRAQGMRNSVEIPWGWDFSWGKALLRKGCKVERQRREEEQVQNQDLIPRAFWKAEETSERKTIQAERQKKVGTPLEQGRVEEGERGRKGISWQQLCSPCLTPCVSHRVCITAVPGMWSDREEIRDHYKNTQPSSEGVRESSGIKDDAERMKCCGDRNNRALCSQQQPELGMKTGEGFLEERRRVKILYQAY